MLKLKIDSTDVSTQSGTSQRTGKPYEIRAQFGTVAINGEVRRIKVRLDKTASPYAVGMYEIADESLAVNQYGELTVGKLVLRAIGAKVAA